MQRLSGLCLWLLVLHAAAQPEAHSSTQLSRTQPSRALVSSQLRRLRADSGSDCAGGRAATPQRAKISNTTVSAHASTTADNSRQYVIPANAVAPSRYIRGPELATRIANSTQQFVLVPATAATPQGAVPQQIGLQSVCPKDKPFAVTTPSPTTCRLVVIDLNSTASLCTAWFISPRHVATAGHCAAEKGGYDLNLANPGYLCCSFDGTGTCRPQYTWNLVQWVTTVGYLKTANSLNDGAVFEVAPLQPDDYVPGVPQKWMSYYPNPVKAHQIYMDGYPAKQADEVGCRRIDQTKRYHTRGGVKPMSEYNGASSGLLIFFGLAGCGGESGGRVLTGGTRGLAYGIQTFGSTVCLAGSGMTGVTQITMQAQRCGVCLSCLMQALIDNPVK